MVLRAIWMEIGEGIRNRRISSALCFQNEDFIVMIELAE